MSRFNFASRFGFTFPNLRAASATLALLALAGCMDLVSDDDGDPTGALAPVIVYSDASEDTIEGQFRLNVNSTGGPITRFSISPALPYGATFDSTTGGIVYVLPDGLPEWETYRVIAVGPGGADTTEVQIPVNDSGPGPGDLKAKLVVSVALRAPSSGSLAKSAALSLQSLVVTLTSSVASDTVIRDTIHASSEIGSSLSPSPDADQQILTDYDVKPLRSWTIEVKTLDVNGVTIHQGGAVVNNIFVGEVRAVALNLKSRYLGHVATFAFPDSLASATGINKIAISIDRVLMKINGIEVRDSSSTPRFPPSPATHSLSWDYVRADTSHTLELRVYARSFGSWPDSLPVYQGIFTIAVDGLPDVLTLPYSGPGSVWDPNYSPSNPGSPLPGLVVEYGATGGVIISPPIGPIILPKR